MGWGTSPGGNIKRGTYLVIMYTREDVEVDCYQTSICEYIPIIMESARNQCEKLNREFSEAGPHYALVKKNKESHLQGGGSI